MVIRSCDAYRVGSLSAHMRDHTWQAHCRFNKFS